MAAVQSPVRPKAVPAAAPATPKALEADGGSATDGAAPGPAEDMEDTLAAIMEFSEQPWAEGPDASQQSDDSVEEVPEGYGTSSSSTTAPPPPAGQSASAPSSSSTPASSTTALSRQSPRAQKRKAQE